MESQKFRWVPFTNSLLLGCIGLLTLTGVYGLFWPFPGWMFDLHRWAGWLVIAAIPWKAVISWRSLKRGLQPDFRRGAMIGVSLLLTGLMLLALALGLAWPWRLGPVELWLRQTAVSWHWMLSLALLLPLALHAWQRWPRPRRADFTSRRAFLRLAGAGAAAFAGWWGAEQLARWRALADSPRRLTGSRRSGRFSGNRFPVTHSLAADPIDLAAWRLSVGGAVAKPLKMSYAELLALPQVERIATLDCTLGWYTEQSWQGIWLADLVEMAVAAPASFAVRLESVSGYAHILPNAEAERVILATHVGGETLEHWHGYPLRAVVPTRRGWFWVKWLSRVEVLALT